MVYQSRSERTNADHASRSIGDQVALEDLTSKEAVLQAVREFNALGQEAFLAKYGFRPARSYFLLIDDRRYDSKAIAGAAYGYQHPDRGPLRAGDFSGGEKTVQRVLASLGFDVRGPDLPNDERGVRHWALCANPRRYRVLEAVAHVEIDFWLANRGDLASGDTVAIWQTQDAHGRRGVVALGDVVDGPALRRDVGNPYWVQAEEGDVEAVRVPVRYRRIRQPLWIDDSDAGRFVAGLSVARAKGGTVFRLSEAEWQRLRALVGDGGEEATVQETEAGVRRIFAPSRGQGFGLTKQERRKVELYAMHWAIRHYSTQWDVVQDVSARCSYDLLCRTGDRELRVEVKGTMSTGDQVVLTRREVEEAATPGYELFVCSDIVLDHEGDEVLASGGRSRVISAWDATQHRLVPIAYAVSLDWSAGTVVPGP